MHYVGYQLPALRQEMGGGCGRISQTGRSPPVPQTSPGVDAEEGISATYTVTAGNKWTHKLMDMYFIMEDKQQIHVV